MTLLRTNLISHESWANRWHIFTLVEIAFYATSAPVKAAPVTFAFSGIVTEIIRPANGTFDLPFLVSPGDSLTGRLQFEPILFGQSGVATELQLSLGSETFIAEHVPLATLDNYVVPMSGSAGGIFDAIHVGCSTPGSCATTSSLSGITIDQIRLGLSSGDVHSFNVGENLADATFWNRFELFPSGAILGFNATRTFVLELSSAGNAALGTVFIQGHLGSMIAVPELASWQAATMLAYCIGSVGYRRFRSAREKKGRKNVG